MLHMVTGGSGSGKSEYAEQLVVRSEAERKFYLAAMEVYGEEEAKKVERHKRLRAGKGFTTVERPCRLEELQLGGGEASGCAILLECLSNLAANELFGGGGSRDGATALERIKRGICCLESQCRLLVVVTSEVFSDGIDYEPETKEYIRLLGAANRWLAGRADKVTEVVYGIPVSLISSQKSDRLHPQDQDRYRRPH